VNLLDENIPLEQRDILLARGIRCRVVGQQIAQLSIGDDNLLTLLHRLKQPTLFTRDKDFFARDLCHPGIRITPQSLRPSRFGVFVVQLRT
jgi:hypothetical protein